MVAVAPVVRRGEQRRQRLATLHGVAVPRQGIGRRHPRRGSRSASSACSGAAAARTAPAPLRRRPERAPVAHRRIGIGQARLQPGGIRRPATSRQVGSVEDPLEREGRRIHREFIGRPLAAPAMHVGLRQEPEVARAQEMRAQGGAAPRQRRRVRRVAQPGYAPHPDRSARSYNSSGDFSRQKASCTASRRPASWRAFHTCVVGVSNMYARYSPCARSGWKLRM